MSDFFTMHSKNLFNSLFNVSDELLVNIYETENFYNIEYFLAGISKENIELTFENNLLILTVKNNPIDEKDYIKQEYIYPSGTRKITFYDVDFSKTETSFINGKLEIKLRKTVTTASNVITIK